MASRGAAGSKSLLDNLGLFYAACTAGFFAIVALLGVAEWLGVPQRLIGYAFILMTVAIYAVNGLMSRRTRVSEYDVGGQVMPSAYTGMATSVEWMSGAALVGMTGTLLLLGHDGLAFLLGCTGGFVVMGILISPVLNKLGAHTVPDFFSQRYGGQLARLLAVLMLLACSFTFLIAQIYAIAHIAARFLDTDFTTAIYLGLLGILFCSMVGGMRTVTWTQMAQYVLMVVAFILPVAILSAKRYGLPLPQLTYGMALSDIANLEIGLLRGGLADARTLKAHAKPFTSLDQLNFFALVLCLSIGTASLPHVLSRYFTVTSSREARSSAAWALLFAVVLLSCLPAYAAFTKLEVLSLIGKGARLAELPQWIYTYGKLGMVQICGKDAFDGATVVAACAGKTTQLRWQDLAINTDAIALAMPEIAGLPYVIAGLVAAAALAAALATADAVLLTIASALSHDIYYKMVDPNAPTARRLIVSRILLVLGAVLAAWTASTRPADSMSMLTWALSLAAAGLFPALVLGIWWKRANTAGCIAGVVLGFGMCLYYLVGTRYFASGFFETWSWLSSASPAAVRRYAELKAALAAATPGAGMDAARKALDVHAQGIANWWGVKNTAAALFGLPLGFLGVAIVSLLTPAPARDVQAMVEDAHRPDGHPTAR